MAKKTYMGVNGKAEAIKTVYFGVNGVAKKIKKAYYGVGGVAKLVYSGIPDTPSPENNYLYDGTSTFVFTDNISTPNGSDFTLTTDEYVLQFEKYDATPLYVYFNGELVTTSTNIGDQTITINGGASTLISKGTITVTIVSDSTYGLGEQDFYQFWEYTGSDKYTDDKTEHGNMTSLTLSDNVVKVYNNAFSQTIKTSTMSIPSKGIVTIGNSGFYGCSALTSFVVPSSVTSIENYAFSYCINLTSIVLPNGIDSIKPHMFYMCNALKSINIPNGVTGIGMSAFGNCTSLTSVNIPNSVTSIGVSAFSVCSSLASIRIPKSVTNIGGTAFASCSKLTDIAFDHSTSDSLTISIDSTTASNSAFYLESATATTARHKGNASVLNYDWALCNRTVTFIQE